MKKLFFILLFIQSLYSQTLDNPNIWVNRTMVRGTDATLTFRVATNYASDSLLFVVKASKETGDPRIFEKGNYSTYTGLTATYGTYTTITVTINAIQTSGWSPRGYYWDIWSYESDTTQVLKGILNVLESVQNMTDGIFPPVGIYPAFWDSSAYDPGFPILWDFDNDADIISLDSMRSLLNLDTNSVEANFDSIYANWVNKSENQTITGKKDFTDTSFHYIVAIRNPNTPGTDDSYIEPYPDEVGFGIKILGSIQSYGDTPRFVFGDGGLLGTLWSSDGLTQARNWGLPDETGTIQIKRYDSYVAIVSQSDTGETPTAIVLENDIGSIVWAYVSEGVYTAILSNAFTVDSTVCFVTLYYEPTVFQMMAEVEDNGSTITFHTYDFNNTIADVWTAQIEIRVYR